MGKPLDQYSDAELATLAIKIVPDYPLQIDGERIDIEDEIHGLFDAVEETYQHYRRRIMSCLLTIADMLEYKEPEETEPPYRPMGFRFNEDEE